MAPSLLLTYKEPVASTLKILALFTFVFVSSDATLNIFLAVPFRVYASLSSARHEAVRISFLCSVQKKLSYTPTGLQTL